MMHAKWNDALLDAARLEGDPLADAVICELFAQQAVGSVNALMRLLMHNDGLPPDQLPVALCRYFADTDGLPAWADPVQIRQGEAFFGRYGLQIVMILSCYSLPFAYAMRKGVQVLHQTARLHTHPRRRIVETAQMIIDVMQPNGLMKGGYGVRSVQKVRLIHAAVRYLLIKRGWDMRLGVPLNQEDLAGTLLTFSNVVLDGLHRLGITIKPAEAQAYVHTWNVVGHIMGVRRDLMAHDAADARAFGEIIVSRHFEPSPEGQDMLAALVVFLREATPGRVFNGFPATLIRYFMDDDKADLLAIPPSDWTKVIIRALRLLNAVDHAAGSKVPVLGRVTTAVGHQVLRGLLWMEHGGERVHFRIPTGLREAWGVPEQ